MSLCIGDSLFFPDDFDLNCSILFKSNRGCYIRVGNLLIVQFQDLFC